MAQSKDVALSDVVRRLKKLRETLGYTQARMADTAEAKRNNWSTIESGDGSRHPTLRHLLNLGRNTSVNLHWLLAGEGEMFWSPSRQRDTEKALRELDEIRTLVGLQGQELGRLADERRQLLGDVDRLMPEDREFINAFIELPEGVRRKLREAARALMEGD